MMLFTAGLLLLLFAVEPFHIYASSEQPISVFVSIEPQVDFVRRVSGDRVTVEALVLPGESPATYSPKPAQIEKLAKSKLFFRIGVPFEESLIQRIKHVAKQVRMVDTRAGIVLRRMNDSQDTHPIKNRSAVSDDHMGEGYDPHIWLSPVLVQKQAKTICDALIAVDPQGRQTYEKNYQAFIADLKALDKRIKHALAPVKGGTIFVFHPSFGYFTDEYGLKQIAVEIQGKRPKAKDISRFIKLAKKEEVRIVFVQPQFDQSAAQKIARAIDGVVVPLDPLSGDYFKNMGAMADTIRFALKK